MGGALLSGGHQSSSPFIVGFAGVILAQEGLRRPGFLEKLSSREHGHIVEFEGPTVSTEK